MEDRFKVRVFIVSLSPWGWCNMKRATLGEQETVFVVCVCVDSSAPFITHALQGVARTGKDSHPPHTHTHTHIVLGVLCLCDLNIVMMVETFSHSNCSESKSIQWHRSSSSLSLLHLCLVLSFSVCWGQVVQSTKRTETLISVCICVCVCPSRWFL